MSWVTSPCITLSLHTCGVSSNFNIRPADRLRSRGEPRSARRGPVHASFSHRQAGAGGQRVSGRMTKGKGKLAVLHEVLLSEAGLGCFKAVTDPEHCPCLWLSNDACMLQVK